MTGAIIGDVIGLVFIVAIVYVLVRPRSQAALLMQSVVDMLAALIKTATGMAR